MQPAGFPREQWSWTDWGTSLPKDALYFVLAVLMHFPLTYIHIKSLGQNTPLEAQPLVNVDFVEEIPRPLPVPVPQVKPTLFNKITRFFKPINAPPPKPAELARPQVVKAPEIIARPEEQKIKPLQGKSEFKDRLMPAPKPQDNINLQTATAPKIDLGKTKDSSIQAPVVKDKGAFQIARSHLPAPIAPDASSSKGMAPAEAIQIPVASRSSAEHLTAVPKSDKGSFRGGSQGAGDLALAPSGLSGAGQAPARLVVPVIPIDAPRRSQAGGGGVKTGKTYTGSGGDVSGYSSSSPGGISQGLDGASSSIHQAVPVATRRPPRSLFQITGELATRRVLTQKIPPYPGWAKAQGITSTVVLEFVVTPDGDVVEDSISVKRSSGYPELDDSAASALKQWKFVPLGPDSNQNQSGAIVFNYALQ